MYHSVVGLFVRVPDVRTAGACYFIQAPGACFNTLLVSKRVSDSRTTPEHDLLLEHPQYVRPRIKMTARATDAKNFCGLLAPTIINNNNKYMNVYACKYLENEF